MTISELIDEISAIDAIYPGSVNETAPQIYKFTIPEHEKLIVALSFPTEYPQERPQIVQVISTDGKIYTDEKYIERNVVEMLGRIFNPGDVCIFELLTEVMEFLENYELEHEQVKKVEEDKSEERKIKEIVKKVHKLEIKEPKPLVDPLAEWTVSDPIVDRGSTFIAYVRNVESVEEAKEYLDLLTTDRKISRSSHNMTSWRIKKENGVQYQDFDDDGETAAGSRLLHLLTVCIH